jgi:hypothetical protein
VGRFFPSLPVLFWWVNGLKSTKWSAGRWLNLNLKDIESYFQTRVGELQTLAERGDPWVFLCASSFLEYLAKITTGGPTTAQDYKIFLTTIFFKVCPQYAKFRYASGAQDLGDQMYHVLRCGVVHSFCLLADPYAKKKYGGRDRSILLAHRQVGLVHLQPLVDRKKKLDATIFVAEDFIEDISKVVTCIFSQARKRTPSAQRLRNNIRDWIKRFPPIGTLVI